MPDEGKDVGPHSGDPPPETVEIDASSPHPTAAPESGAGSHSREGPVRAARGSLSAQTRERLAVQLRAMYDTVAQQPVPDRFADLIARLDTGENEKA